MVWNLFKKKYNGRTFTDEDRDKAQEIRAKKAEIRALQQEQQLLKETLRLQRIQMQIDELRHSNSDNGNDDNMEMMLLQTLLPLLSQKKLSLLPNEQANTPVQEGLSLTHEEILSVVEQIPKKQLKAYSKLPPPVIIKWLQGNYPQLTQDTQQRVIEVIQNG